MFNFFKTNKSQKTNNSLAAKLANSRKKLGSGLANLLLGKKRLDQELFSELEALLITADLGINTTDKLLELLHENNSRKALTDADGVYAFLKNALGQMLIADNKLNTNLPETMVILVVGINGAGKTTTIGKLAKNLQNQGKSVMLAAADTFRMAAVEQLKVWGERNNIAVVAQATGSDAASVAFDAYQSAQAKNIDVLIVDTAGRLHTQGNLMQELEKIKRVLAKQNPAAPHETMLVIDGNSGQNALTQAQEFHKVIGINSISITKLDGSAKGGVVFAIADELRLPIRYIGVGEGIDDLRNFDADEFIQAIFD